MKSWKVLIWLLGILAAVLIAQFVYLAVIYSEKPSLEKPDLVVVYSGINKTSLHCLELARQFNCPIYFSENIQIIRSIIDPLAVENIPMTIDPRARTTDQNARYAAPFIRKGSYRHVALVCAWFHEPRALFLTRLYLLGSGAKVAPYPNEPTPEGFWTKREFWLEVIKFWGSLMRVVLHWFGIDNWPHPELLASY